MESRHIAALSAVVLCSPWCVAQGKQWSPPHPSATVLKEIAAGSLQPETLKQALTDCTALGASELGGCGSNLADVLTSYGEIGAPQRKVILDALQDFATRHPQGPGAEYLSSIEKRLTGTVQASALPGAQAKPTAPWYVIEASGQGPPRRSEMSGLPFSVYKARLLAYLDGLLPSDPASRVPEALKAAAAADCASEYDGKVINVCEDLGLFQIQWASLWLAFMDLRDCKGDPVVIGRYLRVDRKILEKALENADVQSDEGLARYSSLLHKWCSKAPTKWEAWADLEATFVPAMR